jgi:hypothetical protein
MNGAIPSLLLQGQFYLFYLTAGLVTRIRAGLSGFDPGSGKRFFKTFKPAMEPTHPFMQ